MRAVARRLDVLKYHQRNVKYVNPEERVQPERRVRRNKRARLTSDVQSSSDEEHGGED